MNRSHGCATMKQDAPTVVRRQVMWGLSVLILGLWSVPIEAFSSVRQQKAVLACFQPSSTLNRRNHDNLLRRLATSIRASDGGEVVRQMYTSSMPIQPLAIPMQSISVSSEEESSRESDNGNTIDATTTKSTKKQVPIEQIRQEGGLFAFRTKYGALNPYGIYYGLVSILLGIPWFFALTACQLFYFVTGNRIDKQRKIPILITQVWGVTLMRLTRNYPHMENLDILKNFYKEKRPAMFVANHNSWMDIPYLGATIGWRNYKLVSKKELGRVPILGKAIRVGGHIMVDRLNRKSQLQTLKKGIEYLKDGVHLCTYPEGTRSRDGRLMSFKNGAFKMAHKAGAPIIPISIVRSGDVMPPHWMFPNKASRGVANVVVHDPVESAGKTEEQLAAQVRKSLISGLPEPQRPLGE